MTLNSITAVVDRWKRIKRRHWRRGRPVMGAMTLGFIQNIVLVCSHQTWWETLVKALIIVAGAGNAWRD